MRNRKYHWFLIMLGSSTELFARAGGGGSGGSTTRGIGAIILVLVFFAILYYRTWQSKRQATISMARDPNWNYDFLIKYAEDAFMRIQDAWMKKNLDLISDIITDNLRAELQKGIRELDFKNMKNVLEDIEVDSVKIIGAEDYADNEKDCFTAYIKGSMIDKEVSGLNGHEWVKLDGPFRDLYYFKRHENTWLVDKIDTQATIGKVFSGKHVIEE
jgi:predicted lipid-binding transport protein (Tim44 family)